MRINIYIFFGLILTQGVAAQGLKKLHIDESNIAKHQNFYQIEVFTKLHRLPEYRNITQKIRLLKKRKSISPIYQVGDRSSFFVRDILALDRWNVISALCLYKSSSVAIWISEADLESYSDSLDIQLLTDSLNVYLETKTPSGSVNSDKGILEIDREYFGSPPDVDGDGILDILLLDIEDGFEETGGFVAGFFDPVDLIEHEFSNQRDLIYIDIFPTLFYRNELHIARGISTIAHEFQHLIHANYETAERQYTFINEGLSEYAEVLSGFSPRNPEAYYQQPNRALFSWNYNEPISDYARSSLFFTYLFEQLGADKAKYLVQDRTAIGYQSVLDLIDKHSNRAFEEIFRDWGLALLGAEDENLSFAHSKLKNIQPTAAKITAVYPSVSNAASAPLSHSFYYSALTKELELISKQQIKASALADYPSGVVASPVQTGTNTFEATNEAHGSLWLLLSNTEPQISEPDTLKSVQSILFTGEKSGRAASLMYDDGIPDTFLGNASFLQLGDNDTEVAVLFSSAQEFWLSEISLKTIFSSELSGSGVPATSPRDVSLQVYSVKNKAPDQPLTPAFVHAFSRPFGNLKFESVSLAPFYDELSALADSIAVVIKNDADDQNYVALGMDNSGENHSAKKNSDGSWTGFEKVSVGGSNLSGWNPMLRATSIVSESKKDQISPAINLTDSELQVEFTIGEEIDSALSRSVALSPSGLAMEGVPDFSNTQFGKTSYSFPIQVGGSYAIFSSVSGTSGIIYESKEQWKVPESAAFRIGNNYPNPFNPSTTIPFLLLEDGRVGVTVYDVIGRKVRSVPERFYAAGNQTMQLDFAGMASGMYLLKIDVTRPDGRGAITRIRKVTFVK